MANPITEAERFEARVLNESVEATVSMTSDMRSHEFRTEVGARGQMRDRNVALLLRGFQNLFPGQPFGALGAVEVTVVDGGESTHHRCTVRFDPPLLTLVFEDGSTMAETDPQYRADQSDTNVDSTTSSRPRDDPTRLYEPIDTEDYANMEKLLGALQDVLEAANASDVTYLKVEGAIEVLRESHRSLTPGADAREGIWTTTKNVIRFMAREVPGPVLQWAAVITMLSGWWPNLGALLQQLMK